MAFPPVWPLFFQLINFLAIQQCSTGSRKPKIPLLVERGKEGEDPSFCPPTLSSAVHE